MRNILTLVAALGVASCVDSSTGTGSGGDNSGVSSTDPSGNWNATQYTLTSIADASKTVDYVQNSYASTVVITSTDFTATAKFPTAPTGPIPSNSISGKISLVGNNITIKAADSSIVATGTFSRSGNSMTLDLSGKGVTYDFNKTGTQDPAKFHANLVAVAH